jgi:NADPH:quinone reductase
VIFSENRFALFRIVLQIRPRLHIWLRPLSTPERFEPTPRKRRGMTLIRYDGISGVREFERLNAAVQAARLKVPIAEIYSLDRPYRAHERLAQGQVLGKIVLAGHAS